MSKEKLISIIVAVGVLLSLGGVIVLAGQTGGLLDEFSQVHQKVHSVQQEREQLELLHENFSVHEEEIQSIRSLFFNPEQPLAFIGFIESHAQQYGLEFQIQEIQEFEARQDVTEAPWSGVRMRVTSMGSFADTMRLLETLERAPYVLEIETVSLEDATERASVGDFSTPLEGDIFMVVSFRIYADE